MSLSEALEIVLTLARVGANESYTSAEVFTVDMQAIALIQKYFGEEI